jgi:hypothetical protein
VEQGGNARSLPADRVVASSHRVCGLRAWVEHQLWTRLYTVKASGANDEAFLSPQFLHGHTSWGVTQPWCGPRLVTGAASCMLAQRRWPQYNHQPQGQVRQPQHLQHKMHVLVGLAPYLLMRYVSLHDMGAKMTNYSSNDRLCASYLCTNCTVDSAACSPHLSCAHGLSTNGLSRPRHSPVYFGCDFELKTVKARQS